MPSHVVFLRAVNVGKRQLRMADLRAWLADEGFTDVETYIQTGNVRVSTPMRSRAKLEQRLESILAERCGFDVPCIATSPAELAQVHADALALESPFGAAEGRRYVVFFKDELAAEATERMAAYDPPGERIWAVGRTAHVWITDDFHTAKVFGAFKKALADGTVRDLKVVATLAQKWGR
ncbi:MAG: hypothetical protein AVDCRST_MAG34-677 [uncultured Nocardioidaceae bacterium]|uniref:DUF1697 domain-containing protein n=1 Tax=uncultured Nocardioidaceae bacterium TaxID=253824 RepID=A0A6J4LQK1_9ACTN|nr:MAG: hypothetical protein AVDCRST_MAG34-677 [uncultured Nocardioidaceae bacterium]